MRIQKATKFDVRMKPQIQITGPNATLRLDSGEWRQEKCGAGAATGNSGGGQRETDVNRDAAAQ
jgi:hypothetical protein